MQHMTVHRLSSKGETNSSTTEKPSEIRDVDPPQHSSHKLTETEVPGNNVQVKKETVQPDLVSRKAVYMYLLNKKIKKLHQTLNFIVFVFNRNFLVMGMKKHNRLTSLLALLPLITAVCQKHLFVGFYETINYRKC